MMSLALPPMALRQLTSISARGLSSGIALEETRRDPPSPDRRNGVPA
jgi:hypothetical protein